MGRDLGSQDSGLSARSFFVEAAEFGIANGITAPVRDGHYRAVALTFASDQRPPVFLRCVKLHRPALECLTWAARGKSAWEIDRILAYCAGRSHFIWTMSGPSLTAAQFRRRSRSLPHSRFRARASDNGLRI
jgi:hypothetical protein